jgi:soluble lytic murein transglycosylase-like protein
MRLRGTLFIALCGLAGLAPAAWAGERVTLSNGFAMACDHHAQVEDRTRLYLGASEDNYIEFPSAEVTAIEVVPDPPAQPIQAVVQPAKTDAKLNPADLGEMLAQAGKEHNLDVDLLASVVKAESGGNAHAVSRAGARGLMQLMPDTAAGMGVNDSFEPEQNVRGGSAYLDALLGRYQNNLALALAAYNAGPAAVDKYHGIPPYHETRAYVARVIHEFNRRVLARERQARSADAAVLAPPAAPSR